MTQRMVAIQDFDIAGHKQKAGDVFKVKPRAVGVLSASGNARPANEAEAKAAAAKKGRGSRSATRRAPAGSRARAKAPAKK